MAITATHGTRDTHRSPTLLADVIMYEHLRPIHHQTILATLFKMMY